MGIMATMKAEASRQYAED